MRMNTTHDTEKMTGRPKLRQGDAAPRGADVVDYCARWALGGAALVSSVVIFAILGFLLYFSAPLLSEGMLAKVLSWDWQPFQGKFGVLPMVVGSMYLAFSSLLIAYPAAVGVCCFAHGLGPRVPARMLMGLVHFMTSIPTVVYGFVSVFLLVPAIRTAFESGTGFSLLAASITLAVLVLPTIALLINTEMQQVAPRVGMTCRALGLTKVQELLWVVLPGCFRGLIAAAVLGFGRAMGDTLVSLMVAGNAPQFPHSLLDSVRTLTAHIALVLATDVNSAAYASLFGCGLILFLVTAAVNLGLRWIEKSSRPDRGIPGA